MAVDQALGLEPGAPRRTQFIVLMGRDGAGKTSIIERLAELGFPTISEDTTENVFRALQKHARKHGSRNRGDALHLEVHGNAQDLILAHKMMAELPFRDFPEAIFLDRTVVDTLAHRDPDLSGALNKMISEVWLRYAHVFEIMPLTEKAPRGELRTESDPARLDRLAERYRAAYQQHGYDPEPIPHIRVPRRLFSEFGDDKDGRRNRRRGAEQASIDLRVAAILISAAHSGLIPQVTLAEAMNRLDPLGEPPLRAP